MVDSWLGELSCGDTWWSVKFVGNVFVCRISVVVCGGTQEEKLQYFCLRRSKNCLLDDDNGTSCHTVAARGFHVECSILLTNLDLPVQHVPSTILRQPKVRRTPRVSLT